VLAGGAVMFIGNFINIQGEKKRNLKRI
jgi:hypothetical protein